MDKLAKLVSAAVAGYVNEEKPKSDNFDDNTSSVVSKTQLPITRQSSFPIVPDPKSHDEAIKRLQALARAPTDFSKYATKPSLTEPASLARFIDSVQYNVNDMRRFREYKNDSIEQKSHYRHYVKKVTESVVPKLVRRQWNETDVINTLHLAVLKHHGLTHSHRLVHAVNDYGLIEQLYTDKYEGRVPLVDHYRKMPADYARLIPFYPEGVSEFTLPSSNAKLSYNRRLAKKFSLQDGERRSVVYGSETVISLDGKNIAELWLKENYGSTPMSTFVVRRADIVPLTDTSERHYCQFSSTSGFKDNARIIEQHLNQIANQLINGNFADQEEVIELIIDYKILNSLPFAIEGMLGTQFKNIVKMNYLVEHIKEHFSDKIDPHLTVPYPHRDESLLTLNEAFASPELAIIFHNPDRFRAIEKQQIKEATRDKKNVSGLVSTLKKREFNALNIRPKHVTKEIAQPKINHQQPATQQKATSKGRS